MCDEAGHPLGTFGKDFAKSLFRSTRHLSAPGSAPGPLTSSRG